MPPRLRALPAYSVWLVTTSPDSPRSTDPVALTLRSARPPADRQPGDRAAAPGDLRLVQAFVNTFWDLDRKGAEQFGSAADLAEWLATRELIEPGTRLSPTDLWRALDVREGLRALLFVNNGAVANPDAIERLNRALRGPGLFAQLDPAKPPDFKAMHRDFDAVLALMGTIVAVAQLDGGWSRLKACRGDHCGWAFYDRSRNQASNWCAMSVCGSRAKARDYRKRQRRRA